MRVTEKRIFDGAAARAGRAREEMTKAAEIASTGIRVSHPGDDPVAAGQIVAHRLSEQRQKAMVETTGRASDELQSADNALGEVGTLLTRARELAMQMSNGTYSAQQRLAAKQEIDGLQKDAVAMLNVDVGGRYLFGGYEDRTPPFDAAGNYLGDANVRQLQLSPGILQETSVRADVAMKGVGGGVDVFQTFSALSAALGANDVAGVQAALTGLDAGIQQVASARTSAGASMSVLDAAKNAAASLKVDETIAVAKLTEADAIESATKLALTQRALDAALTASAKSFQLTLLDKLR